MAGDIKRQLLTVVKKAAKTLIKTVLFGPATVFNACWNFLQLRLHGVKHGKHIKIHGRIHIHGSIGRRGAIEIGDYFVCNSGTRYNPTSGTGETHITVGKQGRLLIGSHVGISNLNLTANNEVRIGDYTMIGSNCMITDTDFHSTDYEVRKKEIDSWFAKQSDKAENAVNNAHCDYSNSSDRLKHYEQSDRTPPPTPSNISSQLDSSGAEGATTKSPHDCDKHTTAVTATDSPLDDSSILTVGNMGQGGARSSRLNSSQASKSSKLHGNRMSVNGSNGSVRTAPVLIGSGCFIGARVIILKGSKVGNLAVIGAGSVVTGRTGRIAITETTTVATTTGTDGSVIDNGTGGETWAGNPARRIKAAGS